MALVRYGGGIVQMSGSIAGNTFARNRYGNYVRSRIAPVNPQSPRQSAIRAIVAFVTTLWLSTLTQLQRDAWAVFANNVPAKNKLGEVINLSGFNQFVKSNIVAVNVGLAPILDAPVIFDLPGEDPEFNIAVDAGTGKITVAFDDNRDWLDEDDAALVVQMGIPVNSSISFFNGPWRHAGFVAGDSAIPPTTPDANIDVAFPVANGQRVYIRAKILRADGRLSDFFRTRTLVATA